ncbi:trypsin-like serine peptidase [Staphylococcus simulans]|uniref:trypsin-like serine peptidase n=1 Tax=Staphylococcus simulans TaxID=1286 RepID=UPI00399BD88E
MKQGFSMGKYVYSILLILMLVGCILVLQNSSVYASEMNQKVEEQVDQNNLKATPPTTNQQVTVKPQAVPTKAVQKTSIVPNKIPKKSSKVITTQNKQVMSPVKTQPVKATKTVAKSIQQTKDKPVYTSPKGIKPQHLASTVKKAKPTAKTVSKKKATVVSKKKTIAVPTKPKPKPKPVPKVAPKATVSNYYNQAPNLWPKGIPGSENVRDFGQTTYASGINDALKIMKASGNKGVTINHTTAKAANIATVFNYNPTTQKLTYGTGTAIGKHTILTANHVVNDSQAGKPMTPSKTQNLRIDLLREGSKVARTVNVTGIKMLQYGDVALLYTNEDLSQYMTVRKIAPEASITNIKANSPIQMYHYGLPAGTFKNDPMGTMYYSTGKYSMMARNVNPVGYYQMMAEPGSSGGAVLNSKNEVLGVHAFRIASGEYQTYNLNTMAELRGKLRQEVIKNIK